MTLLWPGNVSVSDSKFRDPNRSLPAKPRWTYAGCDIPHLNRKIYLKNNIFELSYNKIKSGFFNATPYIKKMISNSDLLVIGLAGSLESTYKNQMRELPQWSLRIYNVIFIKRILIYYYNIYNHIMDIVTPIKTFETTKLLKT